MITSNDIASKRFDKAMSGYRVGEVDSFLAEAAASMTQLNHEIASLKKQLEAADGRLKAYQEDEDSIRQALLNAQRLADNILKDARAKAELTMRDAEIKAEKIIERSKTAVLSEQQEFDRIKDEVTQFRASLLKLYRSHLELINELPVRRPDAEEPDEPAGAEGSEPGHIESEQAGSEQTESEQIAVEETFARAAVTQAAVTQAAVTAQAEQPEAASAAEEQSAAAEMPGADAVPEEPQAEEASAGAAQAETSQVHVNLQFNEKTGEYLPVGGRSEPSYRRDYRYDPGNLDDDYLSGRSKRQRQ